MKPYIISILILIPFINFSQDTITKSKNIKISTVAELGFLGVLDHKIQFSQNGTYFDYVKDGGQDVVFPISRLSTELEWNKQNTVYFLYQPLRIESQVLLKEDLLVDSLTFPA